MIDEESCIDFAIMEKPGDDIQIRSVLPAQKVKVYGPARGGRVSRDTGAIVIATLLCLPVGTTPWRRRPRRQSILRRVWRSGSYMGNQVGEE